MGLCDIPLVRDGHTFDHEESEILDYQSSQIRVVDRLSVDIEAEVLTLNSSTVGEHDVEVKQDSHVGHSQILPRHR